MVKPAAGINVTATLGTFLLICVKQLMHSVNINYLSEKRLHRTRRKNPPTQKNSVQQEETWRRAQLPQQLLHHREQHQGQHAPHGFTAVLTHVKSVTEKYPSPKTEHSILTMGAGGRGDF